MMNILKSSDAYTGKFQSQPGSILSKVSLLQSDAKRDFFFKISAMRVLAVSIVFFNSFSEVS